MLPRREHVGRRSDSRDVFPSMNSSSRGILQRERKKEINELCPDPSLVMAGYFTI